MIQSDKWSRVFPKTEPIEEQRNLNRMNTVEQRIKMRTHRNEARFKELLENYLDEPKLQLLIDDLLSKILNSTVQ